MDYNYFSATSYVLFFVSLEPAQPTDCPQIVLINTVTTELETKYRVGDEVNCGQFKNCVDGRGFIFDCPEGLAFNDETYRCDWPDQVSTCNAEAFLGFTCPESAKYFLGSEYRFYRSPADCQRYFICIDNKPRLYNCGDGQAFNDLINACDGIENVTGCSPQYEAKFDNDLINACDGIENVTGCSPQYEAKFDQSRNTKPKFGRF
ncbi:Chitin binding Peritrophin-A domain [Popillia japonica]|uniref:Chitin binding Peritrophin-A domain n=1 Tax=Popillia japonica TaxID=7064 RepID=A0AAW1JH30_POPJA